MGWRGTELNLEIKNYTLCSTLDDNKPKTYKRSKKDFKKETHQTILLMKISLS